ncbi:MAG: hypothetical protein R3F61_01490 [Myxococcota bacterium]
MPHRRLALAALLLAACAEPADPADEPDPEVVPTPPPPTPVVPCPPIVAPPSDADPWYTKAVDAEGLWVLASEEVDDDALIEATWLVRAMLAGDPELLPAMLERGATVGIIGRDQVVTDLPEFADLYELYPGTDWDVRTRGLGGVIGRPMTAMAEENLLELPGDLYVGESIGIHELAHSIFNLALRPEVPGIDAELQALHDDALMQGTWDDTYAATNPEEYWAEGVQSFFDANLESIPTNGIHNSIDTQDELRAADPGLADFIATWLTGTWTPGTCR